MVRTASTMMDLGTQAPSFNLRDVVTGAHITLDSFKSSKALLVMFICRHCPYVQHIKHEMAKLGKDYPLKDLAIMAISSNDAKTHPEDSPVSLREMVHELGLNFPLGHDETQEVAKAYAAACTPDFFLFDKNRKLVYRGQLDDSRPENGKPVTGRDLRAAIDAILQDKRISDNQKPSLGCNIKWKEGNEPSYFKS